MTTRTLHIDCDGVLINFHQGVLDTFRNLTDIRVTLDEVDDWHVFEWLERKYPHIPDLKAELHRQVLGAGWCLQLQPFPGARVAMEWANRYVDVHVVTSPWHSSKYWHHERDASLLKHFGIKPKNITHTHRKFDIGAAGDIFVDDKPEHVRAVIEAYRVGQAFLWDCPANQNTAPDLPRIKGWRDLLRVLQGDRGHEDLPSDASLASL